MREREAPEASEIGRILSDYEAASKEIARLVYEKSKLAERVMRHAVSLSATCRGILAGTQDGLRLLRDSDRYSRLYDMLTECDRLAGSMGEYNTASIASYEDGGVPMIRIVGSITYGYDCYDDCVAEFPTEYLLMGEDEFRSLVEMAVAECRDARDAEDRERAEDEREYRRWQYELLKAEFEGDDCE